MKNIKLASTLLTATAVMVMVAPVANAKQGRDDLYLAKKESAEVQVSSKAPAKVQIERLHPALRDIKANR